jgi:hypothetical protein
MRLTTLVTTLALVSVVVVSPAAQGTGIREVTASERSLIPAWFARSVSQGVGIPTALSHEGERSCRSRDWLEGLT